MCCQATISSKTKYNKQSFNFLENKTKKLKKNNKTSYFTKSNNKKKILQQDIRLYVRTYVYILYEHGSIYIKKS